MPNDIFRACQKQSLQTMKAQRLPLRHMRQVMSVIGGGLNLVNAGSFYRDFSPDIVIGVGGGIRGHPGGATASA
jgi:ribulose 1,5-bisphosphate carboxylase large subunit-like protein